MGTVLDNFQETAKNLHLCKLIDNNDNHRIVEPYMVYSSSTGKQLFHCYQISGYSKSGKSTGWKNPEVNSIKEVIILDDTFLQRPEYNPFNDRLFTVVYFSIPTIDGNKRH